MSRKIRIFTAEQKNPDNQTKIRLTNPTTMDIVLYYH